MAEPSIPQKDKDDLFAPQIAIFGNWISETQKAQLNEIHERSFNKWRINKNERSRKNENSRKFECLRMRAIESLAKNIVFKDFFGNQNFDIELFDATFRAANESIPTKKQDDMMDDIKKFKESLKEIIRNAQNPQTALYIQFAYSKTFKDFNLQETGFGMDSIEFLKAFENNLSSCEVDVYKGHAKHNDSLLSLSYINQFYEFVSIYLNLKTKNSRAVKTAEILNIIRPDLWLNNSLDSETVKKNINRHPSYFNAALNVSKKKDKK